MIAKKRLFTAIVQLEGFNPGLLTLKLAVGDGIGPKRKVFLGLILVSKGPALGGYYSYQVVNDSTVSATLIGS